ncbi:MAG: cell wall hydrolase/autolysin [Verrucomicrobiales bacterium]|nr:cell wall hydrolase/autolysin [Verrucomicrobiales bacterium]
MLGTAAAVLCAAAFQKIQAAPAAKMPTVVTPKVEWTPVYYQGRSYVPLAQVAAYYDLKTPEAWTKAFALRREKLSIELAQGDKRIRLNGWTFYLSFPIIKPKDMPMMSVFDVRNLLDPILQPTARRDPAVLRTVILDPAGGGRDTGVETPSLVEKNLTLEVAEVLTGLLRKNGYKVVMTRTEDKVVLPADRVGTANAVEEEAIYINLRAATGSAAMKGFECSTLPPAGTPATNEADSPNIDKRFFAGNISDRESLALATTVQNSVVSGVSAVDLGVRRVRVDELRDLRMAAVSCKLGYLSNKDEVKKLATKEYQNQLAAAIVNGVDRYADFLRRGMAEREEEDRQRPLRFGPVKVKQELAASGGTTEITHPDRIPSFEAGKKQASGQEKESNDQTPEKPADTSPAPALVPAQDSTPIPGDEKPKEDPQQEPEKPSTPAQETPSPSTPSTGPEPSAEKPPAEASAQPQDSQTDPAPESTSSEPGKPEPEAKQGSATPVPPTSTASGKASGKSKSTTAGSGKNSSSRDKKASRQRSPQDEHWGKKASAKSSDKPKSKTKTKPQPKPADKAPSGKPPAAVPPSSTGDRITLMLPITASGTAVIDRSQVELQIFLFESVNGAEIDITTSDPPETKWLSVLPDWKAGVTEWFQASYYRPPFNVLEAKQYGKRRYYGYVARLIYAGRVMDEASYPPNLNRCLYYFTPVFPRR